MGIKNWSSGAKTALYVSLAVFVVAGISVIIALNLRSRASGDAGFDSVVDANGNLICAAMRGFPQRPVVFVLDPSMDDETHDAVMIAVARWNDALGFPAAKIAAERRAYVMRDVPENHVFVETINSAKHGRTEVEVYDTSCFSKRGLVRLPAQAPGIEYKARAAVHEMGHVFGLAHDRVPESVMAPETTRFSTEFLEGDVARLRELWR